MFLKMHYFEEANWLWMASGSPELCVSGGARKGLVNAAKVAREFGFSNVSRWVRDMLQDLE